MVVAEVSEVTGVGIMAGEIIPKLPAAIFRAIIVAVLGVAAPGAVATVAPMAVVPAGSAFPTRAATL